MWEKEEKERETEREGGKGKAELTTNSCMPGSFRAAVLVFLAFTMTLTSSSDTLASSSSEYFFLLTWRLERRFYGEQNHREDRPNITTDPTLGCFYSHSWAIVAGPLISCCLFLLK